VDLSLGDLIHEPMRSLFSLGFHGVRRGWRHS
jgi:hypothetical protein